MLDPDVEKTLRSVCDRSCLPVSMADPNDPERKLILVNAAFERLTGYTQSEVLGRNCRFLQGAETDPDDVAALRDAIQSKECRAQVILNYHKDGSKFLNMVAIDTVQITQTTSVLMGFQFRCSRMMPPDAVDAQLSGVESLTSALRDNSGQVLGTALRTQAEAIKTILWVRLGAI